MGADLPILHPNKNLEKTNLFFFVNNLLFIINQYKDLIQNKKKP